MNDQQRVSPDPNSPGSWVVRLGDADHSYVDPDAPEHLLFDYVQRIAEAIDLFAPPGQRIAVVHVGGGGMSLPRYVAATRPTSAQIVLEPDEALIAEVRQVLPLTRNSGIKIRPVDGRNGIAAMPDGYTDMIIVDAFDGTQVPAELTTTGFLADLRRVLRPAGMVVLNLTDHRELRYIRRVVAGVRQIWPHVLLSAEPGTLKGKRFGNLLVFASAVPLPEHDLQRRAASAAFPYRVLADEDLDRFVGSAHGFTEEDAEPSPAPPTGAMTWF